MSWCWFFRVHFLESLEYRQRTSVDEGMNVHLLPYFGGYREAVWWYSHEWGVIALKTETEEAHKLR
jgi:hypothetical protein